MPGNREPFGYLAIWNLLVACQPKIWRPYVCDARLALLIGRLVGATTASLAVMIPARRRACAAAGRRMQKSRRASMSFSRHAGLIQGASIHKRLKRAYLANCTFVHPFRPRRRRLRAAECASRLEEAAEMPSISRREACGEIKLRIAVIACALVSPARASEVGSSAARPVNLT